MSGIFSKPKKPKIPPVQAQPEPIQEVEMVEEEAGVARRKERKRLLTGGRASTIISGTLAALKKRLGE